MNRNPVCTRCLHYFITHEVMFPYGCRALGFKSKRMPVQEVVEVSGTPCMGFVPKKPANPPATG